MIPAFLDDFETFKTEVEEVTTNEEVSRELELEVIPEDVAELL